MSWSEDDTRALRELCARLDAKCAEQETADVPDELVTALLTSATSLFRATTHEGGRSIPAFAESSAVPATSVVVAVSAMLRAVNMNPFDLSMWFNRPLPMERPGG